MAYIYRPIGCLSDLLRKLKARNVTFLNSLDDILLFRTDFQKRLTEIQENTKKTVLSEIQTQKQELADLSINYDAKVQERESSLIGELKEIDSLVTQYSSPASNIFQEMHNAYKRYVLSQRRDRLSTHFQEQKLRPFTRLESNILSLKSRLVYLEQYTDQVIQDRAESASKLLNTAKSIIQENETLLFGAIWRTASAERVKEITRFFSRYQ